MKLKRWMLCLSAAALLILADQLIKRWVAGQKAAWLAQGGSPRIEGFIGLTYVENRGAAFGMLDTVWFARWFFVALAAVASAGILWALVRNIFHSAPSDWAVALILGGAVGNGIDRAVAGYVVDYIEVLFVRFAIFNLADICVVCGGVLLIISTLITGLPEDKSDAVDADSPA